jgi:hypothetical protein
MQVAAKQGYFPAALEPLLAEPEAEEAEAEDDSAAAAAWLREGPDLPFLPLGVGAGPAEPKESSSESSSESMPDAVAAAAAADSAAATTAGDGPS